MSLGLELDAVGRFAGDLPCVACGHNLRGLLPTALCTECGEPIRPVLRGAPFAAAPPHWLRPVCTGVALLGELTPWLWLPVVWPLLLIAGWLATTPNVPPRRPARTAAACLRGVLAALCVLGVLPVLEASDCISIGLPLGAPESGALWALVVAALYLWVSVAIWNVRRAATAALPGAALRWAWLLAAGAAILALEGARSAPWTAAVGGLTLVFALAAAATSFACFCTSVSTTWRAIDASLAIALMAQRRATAAASAPSAPVV